MSLCFIGGIISGLNFFSLSNLLKNVQFITLFSLINLLHSSSVILSMIKSLKSVFVFFFPNFFTIYLPDLFQDYPQWVVFQQFSQTNTLDFLYNANPLGILFGCILFIYVLFLILSMIFEKLKFLLNKIEWNIFICFFNGFITPISIYCAIQIIINPNDEYFVSGISNFIAYIFGCLCISFNLCQIAQASQYEQAKLESQEISMPLEASVENLKKERGSRYATSLFSLRIIFSTFFIIIFHSDPVIQVLCFWMISIAYLCYLGYFTPFQEYRHEIHSFLYEALIQFVHLFSILFTVYMNDAKAFMFHEKAIIILIFLITLIECLFWISDSAFTVVYFFRGKPKVIPKVEELPKEEKLEAKFNNFIDEEEKDKVDENEATNKIKDNIDNYIDDELDKTGNNAEFDKFYPSPDTLKKSSENDLSLENNSSGMNSSGGILKKIKNQNFFTNNLKDSIPETSSNQPEILNESSQKFT